MSVRVSTWVWLLNLPPSHKLVALALADHAHDDGSEARPSQALISKKTGLSDRQIRRLLRDLLGWGVITVQRPATQHRATCYRLQILTDFSTLREDMVTGLTISRVDKSDSRVDIYDRQVGHPCPTNHKEALLEPPIDLERIKERNRQILGVLK